MRTKVIIFILLFMTSAFAFEEFEKRSEKYEIKIEIVNPDGSIVMLINGKRYRALNDGQVKNVFQTQIERDYLRNELLECMDRLSGRNVGE